MKTKIIVIVEGGIVQEVHATNETEVVIVDYDNQDMNLQIQGEDTVFEDGKAFKAIKPLGNQFSDDEQKVVDFLRESKF